MTSNEIITIAISIIALVVSTISIALQYSVRDDLRFKVADVTFTSLEPIVSNPRTAAITLIISAYNLGNRPAALEHISLSLINGDFDDWLQNPPTSCDGASGRLIVPISKTTYSQLSIPPAVIEKEAILSEELIFDIFFFEKSAPVATASGLLCLNVRFSNQRGTVKSISAPIGLIDISLIRPDTLDVTFNTDVFAKVQALRRVF